MSELSLEQAVAHLQHRLLAFAHNARAAGLRPAPDDVLDSLQLIATTGIVQRERLRHLLRPLYCQRHTDWQRFDEIFDAFWMPPNRRRLRGNHGGGERQQAPPEGPTPGEGAMAAEVEGSGEGEADSGQGAGSGGASRGEALGQRDFALLDDPREMQAAALLAERLARRWRRRRSRRSRLQDQGQRLSLRHTLRRSLRYGGQPLGLAFQQRRLRQPRLVLLLDVSRSMSLYSYVFLRFARGLLGSFRDVHVFAYHTRLVSIGNALQEADMQRVKEKLALLSSGWAGGTRIGESLHTFQQRYGRRLLNRRSIVVIVSDGLDTGDPALLAQALEEIRNRAGRIAWLNPLLGREGYEPIQAGIQAALPLVDLFAPAHNLDSLLALEPQLTRL